VEIDTSVPTRFGNMQYRDIDFLKPGEVVLTFDDGPLRKYSLEVLNALEAHCTKATFFMVGRMAVHDPALVQEIDRRGHTVGTHTWSHRNLGALSQAAGEKEIELGVSAVSVALGKPVAPFFRFPYLSDPRRMIDHLHGRHQGIFSIDIDSIDFRTRSGDVVIDRIMNGLKRQGKGILLFHDIQRSTAGGISELLDRLKEEGYKVVHIVPKAPIETLPEYDEIAAKELAKRAKFAADRPLAKRSVVWPISSGADLPEVEPLVITPRHPLDAPLPEQRGDIPILLPEHRPGGSATAGSGEPDTRAGDRHSGERKTSRMINDDDEPAWRDRVFAN
jgi:peptidoglycan/xylan/chitin deacetylase (PgdA/CDA1 family)